MNLTRLSLTCPATYFVGVFLLALMTTLGCNHQEAIPADVPAREGCPNRGSD